MMKQTIFLWLCVMTWWQCGPSEQRTPEELTYSRPLVYVTSFPLYTFARRIGGEYFDVRFPMSDSGDPANWRPNADTIAAMQQADLILMNGASYEQWLMNVSLPGDLVINTSKDFVDKFLESDETFTHSHGEEGEHEHKGTASHTWMDLQLAIRQAKVIEEAMLKLAPKYTGIIEENYDELAAALEELDKQFLEVAKRVPPVLFSHPVYQYFQKAYGIDGENLHWEPGDELKQPMIAEAASYHASLGSSWLVWEDDPLESSSEALNKVGIQSITIKPGGSRSTSGDYLDLVQRNLQSLHDALEKVQ